MQSKNTGHNLLRLGERVPLFGDSFLSAEERRGRRSIDYADTSEVEKKLIQFAEDSEPGFSHA